MSDAAKTLPIVVRIPKSLGLTQDQVTTLETKWQHDLSTMVAGSEGHAKIKWHITIHIEIGSE